MNFLKTTENFKKSLKDESETYEPYLVQVVIGGKDIENYASSYIRYYLEHNKWFLVCGVHREDSESMLIPRKSDNKYINYWKHCNGDGHFKLIKKVNSVDYVYREQLELF